MAVDLLKVAFTIPKEGDPNFESYTIESGSDKLVIRAPVAADYITIDELKQQYRNHNHARMLAIALHLSVKWNGKPGVSPMDLGTLSRNAYKELSELINRFQLDIVPQSAIDILPDSVKKLLNDKNDSGE